MNTNQFEAVRPSLRRLAYQLTGDWEGAQDIVQDSWLRFQNAPVQPDNPGAYLRRIVINLSMDVLKVRETAVETYPGEWLATPVADQVLWEAEHDGAASVVNAVSGGLAESDQRAADLPGQDAETQATFFDLAVMNLFEKLTPHERAVLILKEVHQEKHQAIAGLLGISEAYSRQILRRLRRDLPDLSKRAPVAYSVTIPVLESFMECVANSDLEGLKKLLVEDVAYYVDSGGKAKGAATKVLQGADAVGKFVLGITQRQSADFLRLKVMAVNGKPCLVSQLGNQTRLCIAFEVAEERIVRLYVTVNPDKLKFIPKP